MKAIYTNDHEAFVLQKNALYVNLEKQEPEVFNHYQRLTGILATDFLDLFLATTSNGEEEVSKMATKVRELLKIDEILKHGMEQGIKQTKIETARALLDLLDNATIDDRIGLTIQEVESIRKEHNLNH